MSQITPRETELFFSENHNTLRDYKIINVKEFISYLPLGLNTITKKHYLQSFGENITKQQYIKFLKKMSHGADYISFDTLIKHYKLQINEETQMVQLNDKLAYKNICQEALFMWWMFYILKQDPFIRTYFNQDKLHIIRQQKIEDDILPQNCNFKFDFGFVNLNILLEINEYAHGQSDTIIQDKIKKDLALLCGYTCISLHVSKVFNMNENDYNKLSNVEIHNILSTSEYLKIFAKKFIYKITSALLKFTDVRDDYIVILFKQMLQNRIVFISERINYNIKEANAIEILHKNKQFIGSDIYKYKNIIDIITHDKLNLISTNSILSSLNNSKIFKTMFDIKHRCVISKVENIIAFSEVVIILKIKNIDICNFKLFVIKYIPNITDINITVDKIFITWEQLSEIIFNYEAGSSLNIMLEMYYREVGRSYEIIIKMLKSHTDSLKTNKNILTNYVNYTNTKSLEIIEKLQIKNKKLVVDQTKEKKITDKIIDKLTKELYDIKKYESTIDYTQCIRTIEPFVIPEINSINYQSEYMLNAVKEFEQLTISQNILQLDTDSTSNASELDFETESE